MANVYYFVSVGGNGAAWSGYFEVASLNDTVSGVLPTNIVVTSPQSFSFVPSAFAVYPEASGKYVTWRTYSGALQFLSIGDGYSFDIWSNEFSTNVYDSNMTWNQMISYIGIQGQGIYALRSDKYTVIYDYGPANIIAPGPVQLGRSGYLQLSTTPVP